MFMAKKRHQHKQYAKNNGKDRFVFTKNTVIVISIIVALVSVITYFGIKSMIPVNGKFPVFGAPKIILLRHRTIQSLVTFLWVNQQVEQERDCHRQLAAK